MADLTVKRTEEFEPTFRGGMVKARAGLGVSFTNQGEPDPLDG